MKKVIAGAGLAAMGVMLAGWMAPRSGRRAPADAYAVPAEIPNLAGEVLTVNGPMDPAQLGETLLHEHIFINFQKPPAMFPPDDDITVITPTPAGPSAKWRGLTDFDESLNAVMDFKREGGGRSWTCRRTG